jgi:hypothetical protein
MFKRVPDRPTELERRPAHPPAVQCARHRPPGPSTHARPLARIGALHGPLAPLTRVFTTRSSGAAASVDAAHGESMLLAVQQARAAGPHGAATPRRRCGPAAARAVGAARAGGVAPAAAAAVAPPARPPGPRGLPWLGVLPQYLASQNQFFLQVQGAVRHPSPIGRSAPADGLGSREAGRLAPGPAALPFVPLGIVGAPSYKGHTYVPTLPSLTDRAVGR